MIKRWIQIWKKKRERIKTVSLILLILSSFALTGLLWYSSLPFTETSTNQYYQSALKIGKAEYNEPKKVWDLTSPPFLIVHQRGQHYLLTQKQADFRELNQMIHKDIELMQLQTKQTTPEEWKYLMEEANAVEMQFFQDMSLDQLDSFFLSLLTAQDKEPLKLLGKISRVIVFATKDQKQTLIWFINDDSHSVVQATMGNTKTEDLRSKISTAIQNAPENRVVPIYTSNEKPPWDPASGTPFSRILYLPEQPISLPSFQFDVAAIKIEEMERALFQQVNGIDPIKFNNESVYVFNNQMLTYEEEKNQITFADRSRNTTTQVEKLSGQIEKIHSQFMLKHYGWTGHFLLEQILSQEHNNTLVFRLLYDGIPVYWETDTKHEASIQLDRILITPDLSNASGVGGFHRSLFKLEKESSVTSVPLPTKARVLEELKRKNVQLREITQIYPFYEAKWILPKQKVELKPYWRVKTLSGNEIVIGRGN